MTESVVVAQVVVDTRLELVEAGRHRGEPCVHPRFEPVEPIVDVFESLVNVLEPFVDRIEPLVNARRGWQLRVSHLGSSSGRC